MLAELRIGHRCRSRGHILVRLNENKYSVVDTQTGLTIIPLAHLREIGTLYGVEVPVRQEVKSRPAIAVVYPTRNQHGKIVRVPLLRAV